MGPPPKRTTAPAEARAERAGPGRRGYFRRMCAINSGLHPIALANTDCDQYAGSLRRNSWISRSRSA